MIKHGDIVFIHNAFTWGEPGTYMAPFIRGFINEFDKTEGLPNLYFNHSGNLHEEDGGLYIYEAGYNIVKKRGEVIKTEWEKWKRERDQGKYVVMTPGFYFDPYIYSKRLKESLGKPYDFATVLIYEPVKILTWKKMWIGPKGEKALKRFMCSKLSGYSYQLPDWEKIDPQELFYNYLFK
jgi:hypothetical protein